MPPCTTQCTNINGYGVEPCHAVMDNSSARFYNITVDDCQNYCDSECKGFVYKQKGGTNICTLKDNIDPHFEQGACLYTKKMKISSISSIFQKLESLEKTLPEICNNWNSAKWFHDNNPCGTLPNGTLVKNCNGLWKCKDKKLDWVTDRPGQNLAADTDASTNSKWAYTIVGKCTPYLASTQPVDMQNKTCYGKKGGDMLYEPKTS